MTIGGRGSIMKVGERRRGEADQGALTRLGEVAQLDEFRLLDF